MSRDEMTEDDATQRELAEDAVLAEGLRFSYASHRGSSSTEEAGERGETFTLALDRWAVPRGSRVALYGPSGCGKSTLLSLIAGLLVPDSGRLRVEGCPLHQLSDAARRAHRIRSIGWVFQDSPLVDYLDALENVLFPFRLNRALRLHAGARARAGELLGELGLGDKQRRRPAELSQGERQRVGIARALITEPSLLLADEPTSGLDPAAASRAIDLLLRLCAERGLTLLTVTHDPRVRERFTAAFDVGAWVLGAVSGQGAR